MTSSVSLSKKLVAEGLGTAMLLVVVVGSGIMAERLAGGNVAIALLANAIATGAGLVALILMFGALSGAHFNPIVTLSEAWQTNLPWPHLVPYLVAQVVGAYAGVAAAHGMFDLPVFFCIESCAYRYSAMVERIYRKLWFNRRDYRVFTYSPCSHAICRGCLHYGCVLVHVIDLIREPCRHFGACSDGYICGDSSLRCARIYRCAMSRRGMRNLAVYVAVSKGRSRKRLIFAMS